MSGVLQHLGCGGTQLLESPNSAGRFSHRAWPSAACRTQRSQTYTALTSSPPKPTGNSTSGDAHVVKLLRDSLSFPNFEVA
jgi:hypothetical protein